MTEIFVFTIGLVFGSFLSALTYRLPRNISIADGRSFCDHCKKKIYWFDNIPLISYILLGGQCRFCHRKISFRNPAIETFVGVLFLAGYNFGLISFSLSGVFYAVICLLLTAIAIIDLEHFIIPDELNFIVLVIVFMAVLMGGDPYQHLFSGFLLSMVLLFLFFITGGRGMGLGDVKLVLPLGMFFGLIQAVTFLMLSFVLGALAGIVLVISGRSRIGSRVPFGPFLVASFFVNIFWGDSINYLLTGLV